MSVLVFQANGASTYEAYRELCHERIGVTVPRDPPARFGVEVAMMEVELGVLGLIENKGDALRIDRMTPQIASRPSSPTWLLGICLEGEQITATRTREVATRPGGLMLVHSATEHWGITAAGARVGWLQIPEQALLAMCHLRGGALQPTAPNPVLRILASHLQSIFAALPQLDAATARQVISSVLPLVDAAFSSSVDAFERAQPSLRAARRSQVLRFVDANICNPQLSPTWIAEQLDMSLRYLHSLFEDQERSLGETILARRLARCHEAIADEHNVGRSITEIAFRFGFSSSSHFSRAFRRMFGYAPSELRRRVLPAQ